MQARDNSRKVKKNASAGKASAGRKSASGKRKIVRGSRQARTLLWAGAAAAVVLVLGLISSWNWLSDNKVPNFRKSVTLYVRPDSSLDEIYATLINEAGVKRPYSLNRAFRDKKVAEYFQPGRYEIRPGYTSVYVARMLNNCWQSPAKLTLSGTMRAKSQIASKISSQLMIDSAAVMKALNDKAMLSAYGFTPKNVFSLFIPDTYEMYWTSTMKDVLDKQKEAYDRFWNEKRLAQAKAQGLTPLEVSILASIVKGETNHEPEMPKIAGVYLNRLHTGMKLQADPTVAYCFNYELTRVLNRHLEYDSPYNTYKYAGLPPGPIAVPTKACLEAVLNPEGDYLYFCANSTFDGTHLFAKSYSDHLRNAHAFQSALNNARKK
ncbi:MAG: endolytic transglycosylase MltG [Bacteroidales bacterium]|nr:endolytic transglycosylase MltG [Candidatus Cryptobacteroides onthequi]